MFNLSASMTDGVLDKDVYVVWYEWDWDAFQMIINVKCNDKDHVYTLKELDFNTGNVYTLSQSTINAGGTDGNLIAY